MGRFTLEAGCLLAEIDPEVGGGLAELSITGPPGASFRFPLLRRAPAIAAGRHLACFSLVPWSNRIAGARLRFRGEERALTINNEDGSALHGLGWERAWSVEHRNQLAATLAFDTARLAPDDRHGWPWPFAATCRYELQPDALEVGLSCTNRGQTAMPVGLGFHPFFPETIWSAGESVEVTAAVAGQYPLSGSVATGPAEPTDLCARLTAGGGLEKDITLGEALDDCFSGFGGEARIRWPGSGVTCTMTASDTLDHLIIFRPRLRDLSAGGTAPLPYFCIEPVSHANDAFNLSECGVPGVGARVLEPGEQMDASVRFAVEVDG